jgi:CheY-like chemotaxis protein
MSSILVIEDNPSNLELMRYLLTAFGHDVVEAESGRAGLDAAQAGNFDVILCDVQLPDINGDEVARVLKKSPRTAQSPLIAVTALAMIGDREHLLASGFDGYIAKPIEPGTFVRQVTAFVPASAAPAAGSGSE